MLKVDLIEKRYATVGLWILLAVAVLADAGTIGFMFYVLYSMAHGGLC